MTGDQSPLPGTGGGSRRGGGRGSGEAGSRLTALAAQVGALETRNRELQDEMTQLREIVERVAHVHDQAPPPFHWDDLEAADRHRLEGDLRAWVRDVLVEWEPHIARHLKPCWWEHKAVRYHVTAVWLAWLGAFRHPRRTHGAPAEWIEVRLPRLREALTSEFGNPRDPCDVEGHRPT